MFGGLTDGDNFMLCYATQQENRVYVLKCTNSADVMFAYVFLIFQSLGGSVDDEAGSLNLPLDGIDEEENDDNKEHDNGQGDGAGGTSPRASKRPRTSRGDKGESDGCAGQGPTHPPDNSTVNHSSVPVLNPVPVSPMLLTKENLATLMRSGRRRSALTDINAGHT